MSLDFTVSYCRSSVKTEDNVSQLNHKESASSCGISVISHITLPDSLLLRGLYEGHKIALQRREWGSTGEQRSEQMWDRTEEKVSTMWEDKRSGW